jgi:16S rRNA (guanine966-N2)-methyltransferase
MKKKGAGKPSPRVIAGKIKGKLIECPKTNDIRPMTSLVKKALFDIIGGCEGLAMLDLFSGSGNISIEAYSRGLKSADLIEIDWNKKKTIEKNLAGAGFADGKVIISDASGYCRRCSKKYDFIMMDPPFKWAHKEELIRIICEKELLNENGFLVIHLAKKEELPEEIGNLKRYDIRKYGVNVLMFYSK